MNAPHRRASYIRQVPDRVIISAIPAHSSCSRNGVDGDAVGFHSPQSVQDEHIYPKELSACSYQTSPLENGTWNSTCSSDMLSNVSLLEDDFNVGLSGHDGHINSFLNFSRDPDFALPSVNHTMPPNDSFKDWDAPFNARLLPSDLDINVTLNQTSTTKSAGSDGWSDTNLLDDGLLMPGYGMLSLEYRGSYFPSCFSECQWLRLCRLSDKSIQRR